MRKVKIISAAQRESSTAKTEGTLVTATCDKEDKDIEGWTLLITDLLGQLARHKHLQLTSQANLYIHWNLQRTVPWHELKLEKA